MMEIKLISWNKFKIFNQCDELHFDFFIDEEKIETRFEDEGFYSFICDKEVLGKEVYLKFNNEKIVVLNELAPTFDGFDEAYYVDDEFGAKYFKDHTEFKLWAPLAHKVILRINDEQHELTRLDKGVFYISLLGDFDGALYDFVIYRDNLEITTIDPYGLSSIANGEKSAVIDLNKTKRDMNSDKLSKFENYAKAIIYEGHVRDLTISGKTTIKNKGKFLGLAENGAKTSKNNPVGLDYIKELGISHLQLLPVLDYGSVDETKDDEYNWGYDPMQFFTLEGSYSLDPNNPYSRINEFKELVAKLHESNIRVNLDVVYNHVYKIEKFSLNKITPNYFFRFEDGKLANHSWCGNDFASERRMARKFILDSLKYLLTEFDVDGFRFDLMGLIDLETIKQAENMIHNIKKDAMIYGEGWDMFAVSKYADKFANIKNASELQNVAFFNDAYRNIVRGLGSKPKLDEIGFLLGNNSYNEGFEFAYRGATKDIVFPHLFNSFDQTINYFECHDNSTIKDAIVSSATEDVDPDRIVKLFNKVLLLSPGIPFIHMGQEFGQSKHNESNTYNKGDKYNAFDVDLMDNRISLINSFKNWIKVRKEISLLSEKDVNKVNSNISIISKEGLTHIHIKDNIIFNILINKDAKNNPLNDLKYKKMELFKMDESVFPSEKILASSTGIGPFKCSIYKEI